MTAAVVTLSAAVTFDGIVAAVTAAIEERLVAGHLRPDDVVLLDARRYRVMREATVVGDERAQVLVVNEHEVWRSRYYVDCLGVYARSHLAHTDRGIVVVAAPRCGS